MQPPISTPHHDTTPLRRRAEHLHALARRIERAEVMRLDAGEPLDRTNELAGRLLRRNVVQLAVAVAELRETADRIRQHADDIDRSAGIPVDRRTGVR
ncbi:MAG: hypothetical protein ACO225_03540 [Ilumatobacteraceae bacterium]